MMYFVLASFNLYGTFVYLFQSRAMAYASQQMREELRMAYSSDQIDKLAQRAELENRLTGGVNNATKNFSTLTLG